MISVMTTLSVGRAIEVLRDPSTFGASPAPDGTVYENESDVIPLDIPPGRNGLQPDVDRWGTCTAGRDGVSPQNKCRPSCGEHGCEATSIIRDHPSARRLFCRRIPNRT
jgi:hypothetical protein